MPQTHSWSRRDFLQRAAVLGLSSHLLAGRPLFSAEGQAQPAPGHIVPGKDPRLVVLEKEPIVLETPLDLLARQRVTPTELVFVRNNQDLALASSLKPVPVDRWSLDLGGLVQKPAQISVRDLQGLEQSSVEMVLQCSGNGRFEFSKAAKIPGTAWGHGGMANVTFAGVPLHRVVDKLGLKIDPRAKFLTVQGVDQPPPAKDDFEHSLPLDYVLQHSLLALQMNGQPLPGIHGGPLRLVTPGYYGTMHVKWINQLLFVADESPTYHHLGRYRLPKQPIAPGSKFEFTFTNSVPNFGLKVRSNILTPLRGTSLKAGPVTIQGVAFNDGLAKIESVLISLDKGQSWRPAQLTPPDSPFAWTPFSFQTTLTAGQHTLWSRAVDALGRTQPLDGNIYWNPQGYEWNGVDMVHVTVT